MKFNIPASLTLKRLLYNKKFTVSISIIIAVVIWFAITVNRNPIRQHVFTDVTASVSIENTVAQELGLGIVSDVSSQKFSVTVSGPNYIVSSLRSSDFVLTASVAEVNSAGKYSLNVTGVPSGDKSGFEFVSISPSTIDVSFDYIDTREYTIIPKLIGVGAQEGLIVDSPVVYDLKQSEITISGPRSVMDKIHTVGSIATVNKTLDATQTYDSEVVLYDENDKIIYRYSIDGKIYDAADNIINNNYLTLSFTSVKVTQPISKKVTLNVKPAFTNLPSGISASDIKLEVDHNTVTVLGPPEVISDMKLVELSPIDFRSVSTTSNSFEVSALLPDGVKILDTIEFFTVSIDTSNYLEKTYNISNIKYNGLGNSLSVSGSSTIRNVKICGPKSVISKIKLSDLYATVNLEDRSAGEHTVEAIIKSDKYKEFWQVGTYSTAVSIKEK